MQPQKNNAWTSPTLYFSSQISDHSTTVEVASPPLHVQDPGGSWQKLAASQSGSRHFHSGSWSAKIMTIVWNASSAQAKLVSTKWRNCHGPNSPQYFCSMSSMRSLSVTAFFGGESSGRRREESVPESLANADVMCGVSKKRRWLWLNQCCEEGEIYKFNWGYYGNMLISVCVLSRLWHVEVKPPLDCFLFKN